MKKMAFIDMEGVLIPELWKHFSTVLNIPELAITTREVADYKSLMNFRINILKENNIPLTKLVELIKEIDASPNAKEFLEYLKNNKKFEVKIISDCFYEFLDPFFDKLNLPINNVYCHNLEINSNGYIENVIYNRKKGKHEIIVNYQKEKVPLKNSIAIGDAFNDFTMLHLVDHGFLFQPSEEVSKNSPFYFHKVESYQEIIQYLTYNRVA
jgi:phosphoserine/homoserine phosphotransferase